MSKKKIALCLFVVAIVIFQFFRPTKNVGEVYSANDISHAIDVPTDVKNILEKACNDCHSNNTNYPWYTNIQPVGWWMANHVEDGKHNINFSEYNTYKLKRKLHKLDEIVEQMNEHEMPLNSYLWIHREAKLTELEQNILIQWALNSKAAIDTVDGMGVNNHF